MPMDEVTRHIAEYASRLSFADLSSESVHGAVQRLIDSLACAIAAHTCEPAQIGRRLGESQGPGKYEGRVLFYGDRMSAEAAAFVNTAMIRNLDFNDRYPSGHPSDSLGSLLSLGAGLRIDGKRFLTSMNVAYEVFANLNDATSLGRKGWDHGFAIGVCTAAGISNMMGLSADQTANAVGIAATNLALRVTRSGELTAWKNAATAYAARNGLFCALLAAEGMAGPLNPFEGRNGFWEKVVGPFELAPFPDQGGRSAMPCVHLKFWPVETNAQPVVWAGLKLREALKPDEIDTIEVRTSHFTHFEIGSEPEKWDPKTRETADHSLPYIFAKSFIDGSITLNSFSADAIGAPLLRPLMARISVIPDDDIEAMLPKVVIRVKAKAKSGAIHDVEIVNPMGHPDNPMGNREIDDKFLATAEPVLGPHRARYCLDNLWRTEDCDDVRELTATLDLETKARM